VPRENFVNRRRRRMGGLPSGQVVRKCASPWRRKIEVLVHAQLLAGLRLGSISDFGGGARGEDWLCKSWAAYSPIEMLLLGEEPPSESSGALDFSCVSEFLVIRFVGRRNNNFGLLSC
jgi:hypothetical protein